MKECAYCGGAVEDDDVTCPHCSATKFVNKCPYCGRAMEGTVCPHCTEDRMRAQSQAYEAIAEREAVAYANKGLVWKTALTFFMPFIGGYFLIDERVKPGFRYFGIAWCALLACAVANTPGGTAGGNAVAVLICLAPIAAYCFKARKRLLAEGGLLGRAGYAVFCILTALLVAVGVGNAEPEDAGSAASDSPTVTKTSTTNTASRSGAGTSAGTGTTGGSYKISSDAAEKIAKAHEAASNAAAAADAIRADRMKWALGQIELSPTTEYLEYSEKDVDPTSLVECSDSDASVKATGKIDLSQVGKQTATFEVTLEDQSASRDVSFTVRDTKAPKIKLTETNPRIEVGSDFDATDYVKSVTDKVDGALSYVAEEPDAQEGKAGLAQIYEDGWYTIDGVVDTSVPAKYSLIVKAADQHGNVKTRELLVTVIAAEPAEEAAGAPVAQQVTYIANTSTHKFHVPSCRDVDRMNEENRLEITATFAEMEEQGYSPCGHCLR